MINFDADGEMVGIDVVGQQECGIHELIKHLSVETNDAILHGTRYVAADFQAA